MKPKDLLLRLGKLKYLRWVGYFFAYLAFFAVCAYVSFPYERLKTYAIQRHAAAQSGLSPTRLEIDELTWSWRFPGIVAEGVRLIVPPPASMTAATAEGTGETPEKPPQPKPLEAERVFVSISPLALIAGSREASFGAQALGGEIAGSASDSDAGRKLELEIEGIDPGAIPQLENAIGLPLAGRLSGHVSLDVPDGSMMKAQGTVDLAAEDLVLGDGKAKVAGMIELPELHMGAFTLKAQITGGRVKLEQCTAQGRDVELGMSGSIRLRPRLDNSMADLELKFSFADKYKTQSDITKAIFGQPDSNVPGLFDTATSSSLAKQDDGSYGARLTGPVSKPRIRPLTSGSRRPTASGTSRRRLSRKAAARREAESMEEAEAEAEEADSEEALP